MQTCRGLHVIGSQRVAIYNVTVNNDFEIPNDDGMDIDSSKDVWVSHCNVTAWDDGICIKTTMRKSAHLKHLQVPACPCIAAFVKV